MSAPVDHGPGPAPRWSALVEKIRVFEPPLSNRAFWATQALIVLIAAAHSALEIGWAGEMVESVEFVPVTFFLIPVIYAALRFGFRGALPTALWCALLTLPNAVWWHAGIARFGEFWQAGIIIVIGVLVGHWIDREKQARAEAEAREAARRESEVRYRRLFETTADPILVLDEHGVIRQANAAAGALFGRPEDSLPDQSLDRVAGAEFARAVLSPGTAGAMQLPPQSDQPGRWVEPSCSSFIDAHGRTQIQVLLHDVTAQLERQEGLEAYARHTFATREEERRRIARDLHDGPVQSLVLLWRRLDAIEAHTEQANRADLAAARALAEEVADELRRFSRALRPSLLDDLGLGPALRAEVSTVASRTALHGRYVETGISRRLSSETELMLLRIAQEALHNVEHHADATSVVVRLNYADSGVKMTIADDGRGMKREPPSFELLAQGKLGIVGMRERARLAGAELHIRTSGGRGTTVMVRA